MPRLFEGLLPMSPRPTSIQIYMPPETIAAIDARIGAFGSRSAFVREAIRAWLDKEAGR